MPEGEIIKLVMQGGAFTLLGIALYYLFKTLLPRQQEQFFLALEQKRKDDIALLNEQRQDFIRQMGEQRQDFLHSEEERTRTFAAALAAQREAYLATSQAQMTHFWDQFDKQRTTCQQETEADRQMYIRTTDQLGKSITGLADAIIREQGGPSNQRRQAPATVGGHGE